MDDEHFKYECVLGWGPRYSCMTLVWRNRGPAR